MLRDFGSASFPRFGYQVETATGLIVNAAAKWNDQRRANNGCDNIDREPIARAAELFEKQPASEKRRLLEFVLSNSTWGDSELTVEFRQPFDLIAVGATELKQKKAARVGSDGLHQVIYTSLDSNQSRKTRKKPAESECEFSNSFQFPEIDGHLAELRERWPTLTDDQKQEFLKLLRAKITTQP